MFETEVLSGSSLGPLIGAILNLDRANMVPILRESGLEFPEAERLKRLSDPATQVVLVRAGAKIAGYTEFAPDPGVREGIYIASLQVAGEYRGGPVFAQLLGRVGCLLHDLRPSSIRAQVQRANAPALSLLATLGFRVIDPGPPAATLDAVADFEILASPLLVRLIRRHQQAAAA